MTKPRILVVEDEGVVSLDIQQGLVGAGYEVIAVVDNGEEAVEIVGRDRPDLVLMDIVLGGRMDGVEAAAHIRDRYAVPVIYLTAHADEITLQRAKVTTPYGYILKPFEERELRPAVEFALDRHRQVKAASSSRGNSDEIRVFPSEGKSIESALELCNSVKPFSALPLEKREALAMSSQFEEVKAGEYIAYEGDDNPSTFLVATGRVIMLKSSRSGKELIVDIVPPGDVFPLAIALEKRTFPLSAKAQIDSKILLIPKSTLRLILEEFPETYREISEQIATRLRESFDMSLRLAHDRVEVRIAAALLGLHDRVGDAPPQNGKIVLKLTRKEMADLAGTTPETASRVAKALESDGVLDLTQAGIVTVNDPKTLEALAAE